MAVSTVIGASVEQSSWTTFFLSRLGFRFVDADRFTVTAIFASVVNRWDTTGKLTVDNVLLTSAGNLDNDLDGDSVHHVNIEKALRGPQLARIGLRGPLLHAVVRIGSSKNRAAVVDELDSATAVCYLRSAGAKDHSVRRAAWSCVDGGRG
jgi:hypothetical protein